MVPYYQRTGGDTMKDHHMHHKHHTHNDSLGSLLDRCGHYLAHRIGSQKRGQESILTLISQHPGITQKGLAEALNIQPASVSELLIKLEKKGLVLREKDENDRRIIKVQLTKEGQSNLAEPKEETSDPFQALSTGEQEQLRSLLEKLLNDWGQRYPMEHRRQKHHNQHHDKENHNGKHE